MPHKPRFGSDEALRVAVLAPISWRVPPRHYGPWEMFCSLLTEGLVAAGHDVTLFATGDSLTNARLNSTCPTSWSEDSRVEPKVAECIHIANVFERAGQFDIIHNSFDFLPLSYSRLIDTPVVTTIHGFSSEKIVEVYRRYNDVGHYVAISEADRHRSLRYAATIHHGTDTALFRPHGQPGRSLLYFGRIHPDKGTATAIEVARRAGLRLVLAGVVQDEQYFRRRVEPHIDGTNVRYLGAVGGQQRLDLLARSYALLHLIDFDEPFGFSVAEAICSGTPVIAFDRGSMREVIDDGVTGFVVRNVDEALKAVVDAGGLDRPTIRKVGVARFDRLRMVEQYVALYRTILAERRPKLPVIATTPTALTPLVPVPVLCVFDGANVGKEAL